METYGVGDAEAPLDELLGDEDAALVVDPPVALLDGLTELAMELDESARPVRLLLSPTELNTLEGDFLRESRVADGVERGALRIREAGKPVEDRVVVADDTAGLMVPVGEAVGVFEAEGDRIVGDLRERYGALWDDADRVSMRAPGRTTLFETATERVSEAFESTLRRAVDGADRLRWNGTPTPIHLALVASARTGEHLYDLCRWGEDSGFASRSSISRSKSHLVERGVLSVSKVPQDRGRPRQRLDCDRERLAEADAAALVPELRTGLDG